MYHKIEVRVDRELTEKEVEELQIKQWMERQDKDQNTK